MRPLLADNVGNVVAAAGIRAQQGGTRKQVCIGNAPLARDALDGAVIERHERAPELSVLAAELGRGGDVEAVVEEDEFRPAGGRAADEDVAGMRVAVEGAEHEHLRAEEVDHYLHNVALAEAEAVDSLWGAGVGRAVLFERPFGEDLLVGGGGRVADPGGAAVGACEEWAGGDGDAVDPFGDENAACAEVRVDERDVHLVTQTGLGEDKVAHESGVVCLIDEVGLLKKAGRDVGCKVGEREGKELLREEV